MYESSLNMKWVLFFGEHLSYLKRSLDVNLVFLFSVLYIIFVINDIGRCGGWKVIAFLFFLQQTLHISCYPDKMKIR